MISTIWHKIKRLGFRDNSQKNVDIKLMNQVAFLGIMASLFMTILGCFISISFLYSVLAAILSATIFSTLILNAYRKFHISRFLVAGVLPTLIATYMILIGGEFGEESILTVLIFLIYLFYKNDRRERNIFYAIMAFGYTFSSLYLMFFPPLLAKINNPYDNLFVFLSSIIWLGMVIRLFQRKITHQQKDQDNLIAELKVKNTNLQKTTEELEQFTYIASHDLKSPLRTIISFLDLIKRDVTRQKYDDLLTKLDFARSGAEQMNFLVTDILEYSKITSGKKRSKKTINLQSVADKVKFNLAEVIKEKNVDLYIFPLPDFYCNETEMTILFQNFIENGIKYNEESTPNIFVKSSIDRGQLVLQFIDNGIGIEEIYFEKIFLFFKRLHTNEVYKGTGLGLGLCKKIIDDMNGSVSVESTMNVGTTFTVRLPNILEPDIADLASVALTVQNN